MPALVHMLNWVPVIRRRTFCMQVLDGMAADLPAAFIMACAFWLYEPLRAGVLLIYNLL
jgi:hypothetical protein